MHVPHSQARNSYQSTPANETPAGRSIGRRKQKLVQDPRPSCQEPNARVTQRTSTRARAPKMAPTERLTSNISGGASFARSVLERMSSIEDSIVSLVQQFTTFNGSNEECEKIAKMSMESCKLSSQSTACIESKMDLLIEPFRRLALYQLSTTEWADEDGSRLVTQDQLLLASSVCNIPRFFVAACYVTNLSEG